MRVEQLSLSEWDELLPDSNCGVFHTPEGLRVLDRHAAGDLHVFGGFEGEQPIGLLPLFIRERFNFRTVLSPPPGFGVRDLGPVFLPVSPKRRKQEKVEKNFIKEIIDTVDADHRMTIFRMSGGTFYRDPRPFWWAGFNVYPTFTYQLDLESAEPDEVLRSFSKSVRRDIRDATEADVTVRGNGGLADVREIYETIEARFDDQEKRLPISWEYTQDMYESLGDRAQVYVAESPEGEFLSGIVVLYSNDTAYFWNGGTGRTDHSFSVNSLLHWRIMEDIIYGQTKFDIERYDFQTANNERIVRYKSKFNGELVPNYRIESTGLPMAIVKKAYRMIAE